MIRNTCFILLLTCVQLVGFSQNKSAETIKKLYTKSVQQEEAGDLAKAIETHKEILDLDSTVIPSINAIAGLYGSLGNFEAEVEWAEKAISVDPDYYNAYINLANAQLYLRKIPDATKTLRTAIKVDPDNPLAYYTFGLVFEALNDLNGAKMQYQKSVEVDPTFVNGLFNLAAVHANLGEMEEAKSLLIRVLEINPGSRDALDMLYRIMMDLGEINKNKGDSFIRIKSISPEPGTAVSSQRTIKAVLEYNIDANQVSEYGYSVSIKFATNELRSTFSSGLNSNIDLKEQSGEITMYYPLKEVWYRDELKHPIEVFFYLHNNTGPMSSTVISTTEAVVYSE